MRFLIQRLELASPQDVFGLVDEIFPDERPPERARLIVEEVSEAGVGDS